MAWFRINGELKSFSAHQLPQWQTAWTLTVHRSQGSQYKQVLLVLPSKETKVLNRELIYTGITRASEHCTLVMNATLMKQRPLRRQAAHIKPRWDVLIVMRAIRLRLWRV